MNIPKLFCLTILGLFMVAWLVRPTTHSQPAEFYDRDKQENENQQLRQLAEQSDVIGVARLIERRTLVDPEKWKSEIENSVQKKTLPGIGDIAKGNVYELEVTKSIFPRALHSNKRMVVKVYSLGDPYSLHTRLIRFLPEREYLIFLTRAKTTDVTPNLETLNPKNPSHTDKIKHKDVFLVTGDQSGARLLNNTDHLVGKVQEIVRDLKR